MNDQKTDLESALRSADEAVRRGQHAEPIVIAAGALWQLNQIIYKQDKTIEQLRSRK